MPWKQWAFLELVSSAQFQDYLQNQTINRFTTAAQRDTQLPSPVVGQACYLTTDAKFLVYYGATLGWRPPWNQPWGMLTETRRDTFMALTTVETVALTTAAVTIPANRMLRVSAQAGCYNSHSTDQNGIGMGINRGATATGRLVSGGVGQLSPGGFYGDSGTQVCWCIEKLAAGTYQWCITGSSVYAASLTQPMFLTVEDVGPVVGTLPALAEEGA